MVKELYRLGLRRQDVEELFRLVDWFLALPDELETKFAKELRAWEEAEKVPYVTSLERIAKREGREEGFRAGRLEEAVRALFLVGTPRFGEPDADSRRRIESETELPQVEAWLQKLAQAESWADLLRAAI
jgi:hypothetical protein